MIRYHILWLLLVTLLCGTAQAGETTEEATTTTSPWHLDARVAYHLGGTAPIPMPATIRSLERFPIKMNLGLGFGLIRYFNARWGVRTALNFERKAMETDARVKNYHMEIVRGGETLAGMFTGNVVTRVDQWMFTIPVQATCALSRRVSLRMGPYLSLLTYRQFDGWAYNGHLRVDDPTGARVELGEATDERGDYDFSGSVRHMQWGLGAGIDWTVASRLAVTADLNWGLSGLHKSNFHTIEQTLYPIFGSVGIAYQLR